MLAELFLATVVSQVETGRAIYHRGEGTSEVAARLGETRVSAAIVPCANCHGADGRGKPEGGVTPPDLRRDVLMKPYAITTFGRTRAPYDERLLHQAIAEGVDSSGNRLNPVMPRYEMTSADFEALMAYLRTLGNEPVPGVTESSIRAGVVLPPGHRGSAARAALERWTAELNAEGGVNGRTLEVEFVDAPRDDHFVLFASFTDGRGAALPVLSAFSHDPDVSAANARYLFAGIPQQARALARYAATHAKSVGVVRSDAAPPIVIRAAEAFLEEARAAGLTVEGDAEAVLVLDPRSLPRPEALMLTIAALSGAEAFPDGRPAAVVFPMLGAQHVDEHYAIASAGIFAEALRNAGRDLTRERFLQAVDELHGFKTPLGEITYRGRRIGAGGAWVVPFDGSGKPDEPRWIQLSD